MTPALLDDLAAVADAMADAARAPILQNFRSENLVAENKLTDGFDPVTVADKAAEAAMRAVLADRRPDDAIHGEEQGKQPGTTGLTWVIDPIDGTRAFLCGAPVFGVLIAVHDGERPIFGMIDQPYIGERFIGRLDDPMSARLVRGSQSRKLATRTDVSLANATLLTTFPEIGTTTEAAAFKSVADDVRLVRYGLDCYGYALVALGQADIVIEAGLNAYDIQGPMAVVQAAGGVVTNWQGGPCDQGGRAVAAGCPRLHAEVIERLSGFEL